MLQELKKPLKEKKRIVIKYKNRAGLEAANKPASSFRYH